MEPNLLISQSKNIPGHISDSFLFSKQNKTCKREFLGGEIKLFIDLTYLFNVMTMSIPPGKSYNLVLG
jgi:hypothetical protein